jgi:hypothetical protein
MICEQATFIYMDSRTSPHGSAADGSLQCAASASLARSAAGPSSFGAAGICHDGGHVYLLDDLSPTGALRIIRRQAHRVSHPVTSGSEAAPDNVRGPNGGADVNRQAHRLPGQFPEAKRPPTVSRRTDQGVRAVVSQHGARFCQQGLPREKSLRTMS